LLCARLRTADKDASSGSVDELQRIVGQIRARWPKTRIIIRADAGFCRDAIMAWCEANDVGYVLGLARNKRLQRALSKEALGKIVWKLSKIALSTTADDGGHYGT
ncbi:transposase, partial [Thiolapillus sp.]|uniref:transposase n=2 Tax=Thiolapillus sp. TaxID=2017437 RepID=UPI0035B532FC